MLCFDVRLNGERVALAGVPDGVLSVIVGSVRHGPENPPEVSLQIGGLVDNVHLEWAEPPLHIGDVIELRVVEANESSPPQRRHPNEGPTEEWERQQYERLKAKFGD